MNITKTSVTFRNFKISLENFLDTSKLVSKLIYYLLLFLLDILDVTSLLHYIIYYLYITSKKVILNYDWKSISSHTI